MEKFVHEEEPTVEELKAAIRRATLGAHGVPVLCGSAFKNKGVQLVLDAVVDYLPSPVDVPPVEGHLPLKEDDRVERKPSDDEPFSALAFKIMSDPYVGVSRICACTRACSRAARTCSTRRRTARSASAACCRCTRTTARTSPRPTRATSWRSSV